MPKETSRSVCRKVAASSSVRREWDLYNNEDVPKRTNASYSCHYIHVLEVDGGRITQFIYILKSVNIIWSFVKC